MMADFQLGAVLAVVILQGVVAVRALGDDFFHAPLGKHPHVLFGHTVENELVAQPAQAVAAAYLILTQNTPGNAGGRQNPGQGQSRPPVAGVKSTGTAHEKQILGRAGLKRLDLSFRRPPGTLRGSNAPGITALLHVLKKSNQFFREPGLHLHQVPAHIDNPGEMLNKDRTHFQAEAAGGTLPDNLLGHAPFLFLTISD